MNIDELLKIEDELNLKYSKILDYLGAEIIVEIGVSQRDFARLYFGPGKCLDFPSVKDLEKVLQLNQNLTLNQL